LSSNNFSESSITKEILALVLELLDILPLLTVYHEVPALLIAVTTLSTMFSFFDYMN
jgi:hypothetical protein